MLKNWLITGCSSGLGKWLAAEALKQGKNVVITARNPDSLRELEREFPKNALTERLDVTEGESVDQAVKAGVERFGSIDVLVNNAGYALRGAIEECSIAEIEREFNVDFFGPVRTIQAVLPYMRKEKNGLIVNYTSIAAITARAASGFYSAAKSALEALSNCLREEVKPFGIRVMVVAPGPFHTNFHNSVEICKKDIEEYAPIVKERKVRLQDPEKYGVGFGNPQKAALVVIKAMEEPNPPENLFLGSNAAGRAEEALKKRLDEVERWKSLSAQSDKNNQI